MTTATLTLTPDTTNSPPRVRLDVAIPAGTGVSVLVTRTGSDGNTYPVRLADPSLMAGTTWVGYDYEAPYRDTLTYNAAITYLNPGTVTDIIATGTYLPVGDIWLVHPGVPALSMLLGDVQSLGTRLRPVNRGIFAPYGRTDPIVVTDGQRKSPQATIVVRTTTLEQLSALIALTADASVLLLNIPVSMGWGVGAEYISLGDLVEAREVNSGPDTARLTSGPYQVVSRPVGGSQSQRTWADVLAESATWQDVLTMRATWSEVLAPTT